MASEAELVLLSNSVHNDKAWERGRLARCVVVNPKDEDSAFGQISWS